MHKRSKYMFEKGEVINLSENSGESEPVLVFNKGAIELCDSQVMIARMLQMNSTSVGSGAGELA
jgi:hypothetical protein